LHSSDRGVREHDHKQKEHKNMRRLKLVSGLSLLALVAVACAPLVDQSPQDLEGEQPVAETTESSEPTPAPSPTHTVRAAECEDPFNGERVQFTTRFWEGRTNFCNHSVPFSEFQSGGPPPDGIPAIDNPKFESVEVADEWLESDWPVMFFEHNGDARAYPLAILIWHEIVNDDVGGMPVSLTFCPLCNATIAFNRTLPDGTVLDFGTTGNLRNSDLVMYDRQTFSWWQQFTGEAIVGDLMGTQLEFLPSQIIAWDDFKESNPEGVVLSRETGHIRSYGRNPYAGYDSVNSNPFFPIPSGGDDRLAPMERVVALEGMDVAYPFRLLEEVQVINDEVDGEPIVIFWQSGTKSTFGNNGPDTGSTGVFSREVGNQMLTFSVTITGFVDAETGTTWSLLGEAVDGPLAGEQLERIVSAEHFWFAWSTFKPETDLRNEGL
jgi:hypothetical protein